VVYVSIFEEEKKVEENEKGMEAMMSKMVEEMFRAMDPEKMRLVMEAMPSMMEQCFTKMNAEEMGSMMHDMMPKMMESCFSKMDAQQRQGMLNMCREMLDQIEAKYKA
jgi:Mg/Co/Ni transporter MgtE